MRFRGDNPFDEIEDLLDRMSRGFETEGMGRSTPVDVADRGEEFVVTVDLPGFDKDDIEVTLADTTLRIAASRESSAEEDGEFIRRERRRESTSRSVRLPETVDEDGIEASHTNGVLTVTLPKRDADGGKRIDIE